MWHPLLLRLQMFAFCLVTSPLLLCLQCVQSILFLENCVKQINMSNDECIPLGMLGGSIVTESKIEKFCPC